VRDLDVLHVGDREDDHAAWLRERGARLVQIDATEHDLHDALPLGKEAFDLVFSSLTLHQIAEWEPLMREFRRVTRPSAALVLSSYHPCKGLHDGLGVDYFSTGMVVDQHTSYYRRPLAAIVSALVDTGWRIAKMVEPRVADAVDPCFLVLRATR
jgi:ubiquinone/menaquinone biosynthesis C-methylase UbiE